MLTVSAVLVCHGCSFNAKLQRHGASAKKVVTRCIYSFVEWLVNDESAPGLVTKVREHIPPILVHLPLNISTYAQCACCIVFFKAMPAGLAISFQLDGGLPEEVQCSRG
mgnify:CR=1 FL=1